MADGDSEGGMAMSSEKTSTNFSDALNYLPRLCIYVSRVDWRSAVAEAATSKCNKEDERWMSIQSTDESLRGAAECCGGHLRKALLEVGAFAKDVEAS